MLANTVGKPLAQIFSEFEGNADPDSTQGSGDVKYHLGATGVHRAETGEALTVSVSPNPSHLEFVNPVVEGIVRAKQDSLGDAVREKVIFQVSDADPSRWNLALNNAKNIQQDLGKDNVQIEIVAYGPGLAMLKADSKVADRLAGALDSSIGLLACENTMTNQHVSRAEMYGGISYVDAGVVHIMKRQREGWAYLRP